jgi:MarR family transcriptional regulator, organic hydroperoxide resistance regulator
VSDLHVLIAALPRIHDALRMRTYRDTATGTPLSEHQLRILGNLDDRDPSMVGELAGHMGVTASTMSLNLKRLETAGFVRRDRDPADRRVVNVCLTEAGREARDAVSLVDLDRADALLRLMRPEERRRALDGLAALADAADRLASHGAEHVIALTAAGSDDEERT